MFESELRRHRASCAWCLAAQVRSTCGWTATGIRSAGGTCGMTASGACRRTGALGGCSRDGIAAGTTTATGTAITVDGTAITVDSITTAIVTATVAIATTIAGATNV